ncbi:MAG: hypothetical protein ACQUYJ_17485, partial [Ferruginibacter sp.]
IMGSLRKLVASAREKGAKMVFVIPTGTAEEFKTFAAQMQGFTSGGNLSLAKPDPTSPNKGIFFLNQVAAEKMFNTTVVKLNAAASAEPAKKMLPKIKPGKVSYQVAMSVTNVHSENILGYLEGTDKKDELVKEIHGTTIGRKRIITFSAVDINTIELTIEEQHKTTVINEMEAYLIDENLIEK